MNDKTSPEKQEREMVLLGLAATDTPMVTRCPSEETLARFVEGALTGQGWETILAHLNRCASCYHHWLEAASLLNGGERAATLRRAADHRRARGSPSDLGGQAGNSSCPSRPLRPSPTP
jgi:hypothetical protein